MAGVSQSSVKHNPSLKHEPAVKHESIIGNHAMQSGKCGPSGLAGHPGVKKMERQEHQKLIDNLSKVKWFMSSTSLLDDKHIAQYNLAVLPVDANYAMSHKDAQRKFF